MSCPSARRALIAILIAPAALGAQVRARDSAAAILTPSFLLVGSPGEDRWRMDQLLGRAPTAGYLLRTASVLADTAPLSWRRYRVTILQPYADAIWNSAFPFSLNDGALWAGRGLTAAVAGGFAARIGRVRLNVVPQIWRAANQPTYVLPPGDTSRKGFSSPWHVGMLSADLPIRFGYHSTTSVDFGESALWITGRGVAAGLSTESQWWGPGLRNALLMSNNAGGIPHAFVRTAAPVRTRFGHVEGRWMIGGLTESRFFDLNYENNLRSLNGVVLTFSPSSEPDLTAGIARVVYANVSGIGSLPLHSFDALFRWGEGNVRAGTSTRAAEQITSLFGRWVFPESGAEVYAEWARLVMPTSLNELLVAPQFSQGFTTGVQWMTPRPSGPRYRVQLEFTNLEQSPRSRATNTLSFYTSPYVVQGYTQRGQVVGASIGPGSSSQWLAVDRFARPYDVGVFAGRIRWDTDAYYTQSTSIIYVSYDASVFAGLRTNVRRFGREFVGEYWAQRRYNYLFQNALDGWSLEPIFDRTNITVRLRIY